MLLEQSYYITIVGLRDHREEKGYVEISYVEGENTSVISNKYYNVSDKDYEWFLSLRIWERLTKKLR